jgi:ribosome-associated heat shock protein Hsp15
MRLDRWLWCARFFKTRALAAAAVNAGHVRVSGQRCKPAKEIVPGARLTVANGTETWELEVIALPARRGPAAEARKLYAEDAASIARREQLRSLRRLSNALRPPTAGRPDKRTRRMIKVRQRNG